MKKNILYLLLSFLVVTACKKEEALNVDLTKSNPDLNVPGVIDTWLTTNFLNPYNMEVLYRFDRFQTPISKDLTPVREEQIQPAMEAVRDVWIAPYLSIAGSAFLKPFIPKQIALVGSAEYNVDGSITLGTADAGRRINLFTINDYDKTNVNGVTQMLHTIHHEFVHILHQNIPVPPDYEKLSPEYVGGSWISFTNTAAIAKDLGFITRYSRMNKDEDFAETSSFLLVEGQDAFDIYANTAIATADTRLRQKEQMIVDYYKINYSIDFRALQSKVKEAKETLTGFKTPFRNNLVAGAYRGFSIDKTASLQSAAFVTAYNTVIANVAASNAFVVDPKMDLEFVNIKSNRADMVLKFRARGGTFDGSFWYNLRATINPTTGSVTFTTAAAGTGTEYSNGTALTVRFQPLLTYLTTNTFTADWIEGVFPGSRDNIVGFSNSANGQLAFHGTIKR